MKQAAYNIMPVTENILRTLGEQIKLARLRRNLSTKLVAERAGISRASLWKVESGNPSVAMGIYAAVLHALNNMDKDLLLVAKADEISEKCDALLESVKADEARMSEVSVLRKHLINYAKTKDVFAAYKASGYNREFYEAHRDSLALRSAAKKAFDAYKKENGSDKKLPRISELNAEYAMLLERKKSSYAEYRKTKSEMQDWLVAQKIVQEILKEDEQKKEQMHEQEVRQEEENRQSSR